MSKLRVTDAVFLQWVTSILKVYSDKPFDSIKMSSPDSYEFDLILNTPHPHTTDVVELNSKFLTKFNKEQFTEEERKLYMNVLIYAISLDTESPNDEEQKGVTASDLMSIHDASKTARIYTAHTVLFNRDQLDAEAAAQKDV
jgi:hypothetical protein